MFQRSLVLIINQKSQKVKDHHQGSWWSKRYGFKTKNYYTRRRVINLVLGRWRSKAFSLHQFENLLEIQFRTLFTKEHNKVWLSRENQLVQIPCHVVLVWPDLRSLKSLKCAFISYWIEIFLKFEIFEIWFWYVGIPISIIWPMMSRGVFFRKFQYFRNEIMHDYYTGIT